MSESADAKRNSKSSLKAIHDERFAYDTRSAVKAWRKSGKPHKR